ncbi:hyalin-like [Diadema setosum]|uniref:hyalin-like n=1 Tax=Diadema setosum TaxID=31175 RepID=UPI003B3ADD5A
MTHGLGMALLTAGASGFRRPDVFRLIATTFLIVAVGKFSDAIPSVDTEPPVVSCPADIVQGTDPGLPTAVVYWTANATDNVAVTSTTTSLMSGQINYIGSRTIVFTAYDAEGNFANCTFNVTVVDLETPTFTGCPSNITVNTTAGSSTGVATWTPPMANDNAGAVDSLVSSNNPGDSFSIGTTVVTYTASDIYGNQNNCTFNVVVEDNENPVLASCPSDILTNTTTGLLVADVTWTVPNATDNSGPVAVNQTAGLSPGSNFTLGSTLVTYTVTDPSGNSASCSFYVNVTDGEKPMFTSCPSDQTVGTDFRLNSTTVNWTEPVVSDNDVYTVTSDYSSGSVFYVGSTLVTYMAVDSSGNTETCTFTITVEDKTEPVVSGCPSNITVMTDAGQSYATVNWTEPVFSDAVDGVVNSTSTHSPLDQFNIGSTNVTYSASDDAGNTATCVFTILRIQLSVAAPATSP